MVGEKVDEEVDDAVVEKVWWREGEIMQVIPRERFGMVLTQRAATDLETHSIIQSNFQ